MHGFIKAAKAPYKNSTDRSHRLRSTDGIKTEALQSSEGDILQSTL